jgi:hypothetical protein
MVARRIAELANRLIQHIAWANTDGMRGFRQKPLNGAFAFAAH